MPTTTPNVPKLDQWLPEAAEFLEPPAPAGDPTRPDLQRYLLLESVPSPKGDHKMRNKGELLLERREADGADFTLSARHTRQSRGPDAPDWFRVEAEIECHDDDLVSCRAWRVVEQLWRRHEPVAQTRVERSGEVDGARGVIRRTGRPELSFAPGRSLTTDWALIDAVQRLGSRNEDPPVFDLLEDLDAHRPDQRLAPLPPCEVELGGESVTLHGFSRLGRGVLPWHYYLDASGRLLMALGALTALVRTTDTAAE
jgi:hypothetical protein